MTLFVPIGAKRREALPAYHVFLVRRRAAVITAAVAALSVWGVPSAPAAPMTAIPPGFNAEPVTKFPEVLCGGDGPTSTTRLGNTAYFAGNGKLYYYRPGGGLGSHQQDVRPWGLTVVGTNMYATQPHCGAAVVNDAVQGNNCTVVQINPNTGRSVREVASVCGYAVAPAPGGTRLTVAERNGRIVNVPLQGGAPQLLVDLAGDPAVSLAWSNDGSRLFFVRQSGAAFSWTSQTPRPLQGAARANSLAIGEPVGLRGSVLTAGDPSVPVKAVAVDQGAYAGDVSSSSAAAAVLLAAPEGIYVAQATELWLLRGQYSPAGPPPTTPPPSTPPTTVARVTPSSLLQSVAPPPPVQAPPPPPPPAPPAPPLATAAQVVAQPSAVANPAIVPGEQEREAAMRLAATGRPRQLAPYLLWLLLAAVCCGGGLGAGIAMRRADVGRYAWADND
jgi:hypothetical protein